MPQIRTRPDTHKLLLALAATDRRALIDEITVVVEEAAAARGITIKPAEKVAPK